MKKKLDWVQILGITASIAGLLWWQTEMQKQVAERQKAAQAAAAAAASASPTASPSASPEASASAPATTPAPTASVPPEAKPTLETPEQLASLASAPAGLDLTFTTRGGGIKLATLLEHKTDNRAGKDTPIQLNRDGITPIGALGAGPSSDTAASYEMRKIDNGIEFSRVTDRQIKITKTFLLSPKPESKDEYTVKLELAFTNMGQQTYEDSGYWVHAGSAEPIHATDQARYIGFDWNKGGHIEKAMLDWFDPSSFLGLFRMRGPRPVYEQSAEKVEWVAVKNQFYTSMLFPEDSVGTRVWAQPLPVTIDGAKQRGIEGALGMPALKLNPGETVRKTFRFYLGPTAYARLAALGKEADEILNFWPFEFVSVFLLSTMNLLNSWVGSYAAAIVILTILIKLCLWPLQSKSMRSMKEMAALQPKIQELKEKYASDPQRFNQEMMTLYKTYGVNPMAGCLPLLVQIPIFFGFYSMLGTAVELRNSNFFWIHDLTQPDTVATLFGFPINLLPLVMAATMVWQMKLTPQSGDPMQRRIFMLMPLIFIAFCYNFASALPLYWTVQNLFSIVQIYLTRDKPVPPLRKKTPEPAASKSGKSKSKKRSYV